jgi:hypothetical protein
MYVQIIGKSMSMSMSMSINMTITMSLTMTIMNFMNMARSLAST